VGCDQDRTLRDIDNRELIYFRVKVTDASGEHGKLLAEADGLIPNPADSCRVSRPSVRRSSRIRAFTARIP